MGKILKYFSIVFFFIFIGLGLFIQSNWAKDKISQIIQEIALQQGSKLKIEKIEGRLPFQWKLSSVRLDIDIHRSIYIDRLDIRFSFLSLFNKRIEISYLRADRVDYTFCSLDDPKPTSSRLPYRLFIHSFNLKQVTVHNLSTNQQATYSAKGAIHFDREKESFYCRGHIQSDDMTAIVSLHKSGLSSEIDTDFSLTVKSKTAFAPFFTMPKTAFHVHFIANGPWQTWNTLLIRKMDSIQASPIKGNFHLQIDQMHFLQIPQWEGILKADGEFNLFPNQKFHFPSVSIQSDLIQLNGMADLNPDFLPQEVKAHFELPHLNYFSSLFDGHLKGHIFYDQKVCQIESQVPRLRFKNTIFENSDIQIDATYQNCQWIGALAFSSIQSELGFQGKGAFSVDNYETLTLSNFAIQSKNTSLVGDLSCNIKKFTNLEGGCLFQIDDLSPFSRFCTLPLGGQISGKFNFKEADVSCQILAKNIKVDHFTSERASFDFCVTDIFQKIKGKLSAEIYQCYMKELFLEDLHYSMEWDFIDWDYKLQASGEWKKPFQVNTEGRLTFSPKNLQLQCHTLNGIVLDKDIVLEKPFDFFLQDQEVFLSDLQMRVGEGSINSSLHIQPTTSSFVFHANHFPLDFASLLSQRFSLKGLSFIDIELKGSQNQLQGFINAFLERADIYPAGTKIPIQTKGTLQVNIDHNLLQLHTHLVATGQQFLDLSASLPISYTQSPFSLTLDSNRNISAQCMAEGHLEQLLDFINLGAQRLGGFLSTHLIFNGTLEHLFIWGPFQIQKGFYQNYFIGMDLNQIDVEAEALGSIIAFRDIHSQDEFNGSLEATATITVNPELPFELKGNISRFRPIQFDWLSAPCNGDFEILGNLKEGLIKGDLTVAEAQIRIPEKLPISLPSLPVQFVNQPDYQKNSISPNSSLYPFEYDLNIKASDNISLFGRGLNALLQGNVHLTGRNLDLLASGSLRVDRGKFSFGGKEFVITQGEVVFSEKESFLNIDCTTELPNMVVTILLRGTPTAPELTLQSTPPRATSDILASILFNKEIGELNAIQAIQLANAAVTLSGPNVIDALRQNLGIDRLSISSSEETGQISVQISKEFIKGVMVTLSQSTESSQVIVEVQLKRGFVLQAETQENNQGKFSVKWNKNY